MVANSRRRLEVMRLVVVEKDEFFKTQIIRENSGACVKLFEKWCVLVGPAAHGSTAVNYPSVARWDKLHKWNGFCSCFGSCLVMEN
jgi:hypothetical protein